MLGALTDTVHGDIEPGGLENNQWGETVKKHKIEIQKEWEKKVESEWRPLLKKIKTAMENYKEKGWYHHTLMFCLVEIKICDYLIDGMS